MTVTHRVVSITRRESIVPAIHYRAPPESRRGGERHDEGGLGGLGSGQGRGHQEGVGHEGRGREAEERFRGGARQGAHSGHAGEQQRNSQDKSQFLPELSPESASFNLKPH